jgi:DNA polymerase (family 10)
MNNRELAEVFEQIADLLEIKGEKVYRIIAYRRGAEAVRTLGRDVKDVWRDKELESIPGVGKAIASKIDELLQTGKLDFYDKLTKEIPAGLIDVLKVGDVGPKKAARFWKELNITSVAQLEKAAKAGKLGELSGMGERSEKRILDSIQSLKRRKNDRVSIGKAWPVAEALLADLRKMPGVKEAETAGSLRRWSETIGDVDLLAAASDPVPVMDAFTSLPRVGRILGKGDTKASVELVDGTRVQLWVHPPERFGTALQYATGSQAHNVKLRELSLKQGLSLSDQAFKAEDGSEILCKSEPEVYERLGLPWVPPELREDRGEVQAAQESELPQLIELKHIRGELHAHTQWSDGGNTVEEMALEAISRKLKYLVITDHSQSLGIANGLSIERLRQQRKEIDKVQNELEKKIKLFQGAEVEILSDGKLDYPDEVLAELDLVIASLHTSLRQPREKVTMRMMSAVTNPHVDMIAHPSGRLIGKRDPADLDIDLILQEAAKHNVILEINANPERLDLNEIHARRALEFGCMLSVTTDAHKPDHLDFRKYGIGIARRAWATPQSVFNSWTPLKVEKWLSNRG